MRHSKWRAGVAACVVALIATLVGVAALAEAGSTSSIRDRVPSDRHR